MKNSWPRRFGLPIMLAGAIFLSGCSSVLPVSTSTAPATVAYTIGSGGIEEYSTVAPNVGSPLGTLTLPPPYSISGAPATDSTGQVYISASDISGSVNSEDIFIYPPSATGTATPSRTIKVNPYPNACGLSALAVDHASLTYVVVHMCGATAPPPVLLVYSATASGVATPIRSLQLTNVGYVSDMAVDAAGNIYVAGDFGAESAIAIYSPNANGPATPARMITFGTSNVYGVAVDSAGDVFANVCLGCYGTNFVIEEFAPGASGAPTPINTISLLNVSFTSLTRSIGGGPVRLDGAGNIFTSLILISDPGANLTGVIYGFGPTATGPAVPTVQITSTIDPNAWFALN